MMPRGNTMRTVRCLLAALAAPVLVLGLAACAGSDEPAAGDGTTTERTTEDPTTEETTSEEAPSPVTGVEHVWIDDSWEVQEIDDLCAMIEPSPAPYSDQEGFFTCGPNAASALACQVEEDGLARCITSLPDRSGISFTSEQAAATDLPANEDALPIQVTLPDDVTCNPVSHDHAEHFEDYFSWYACSDGSELLTDEDISNTFSIEGDAWTVRRSIDQQAPEEVVLTTATFAGTD